MPVSGGVTFSGSDALRYVDAEPGSEIEVNVKLRFRVFTHDEFGDSASFDVAEISGPEDSDQMTKAILTELGSLPSV